MQYSCCTELTLKLLINHLYTCSISLVEASYESVSEIFYLRVQLILAKGNNAGLLSPLYISVIEAQSHQ